MSLKRFPRHHSQRPYQQQISIRSSIWISYRKNLDELIRGEELRVWLMLEAMLLQLLEFLHLHWRTGTFDAIRHVNPRILYTIISQNASTE